VALHKKEEYFSRKGAKAQRLEALPRFLRVFFAPLRENLFVIAALFVQSTIV
jgi:hypothetical protein